MRPEIGGDIGGYQSFDVAAVSGELIVAARSEITIVRDLAAAGAYLYQRSRDRLQSDIAADRSDLHVSVANIGQGNGATHGLHVHMAILHVADAYDCVRAFECQVALQMIGGKWAGRRVQI